MSMEQPTLVMPKRRIGAERLVRIIANKEFENYLIELQNKIAHACSTNKDMIVDSRMSGVQIMIEEKINELKGI